MDPITAIVTAIALGVADGLKSVASSSIKDAYGAIKTILHRHYTQVDLEQVQRDPASPARRAVLAEELSKAGADKDKELLAEAGKLLEAAVDQPKIASAIAVDLRNIKSAALEISRIVSSGAGVIIHDAEINGPLKIRDVEGGLQTPRRRGHTGKKAEGR